MAARMTQGDSEIAMGPAAEASVGLTSGAYAVKLPMFEGPLDLLLHLIRQNEVEISDIPIARVSEQYLEYLELMETLNLDIAGEYLVMAATLALIKSRMLLPPDEEEDEEEIDSRADLIARLLEYQRFREAAETLSQRRRLGRDVFAVVGSEPEKTPIGEREIEVGLFELLEAFRRTLAAAPGEQQVHEVEVEVVKVRDQMFAVMRRLDEAASIEFTRVFDGPDGTLPSKSLLVATFLAILELGRLGALRLYQPVGSLGSPEGPIRLRRSTDPAADSWADLITETM
jgi:segregation and condensation protein A